MVTGRLAGGLVPVVRAGRRRHVVESTWWLDITWFRALLRVEVTR